MQNERYFLTKENEIVTQTELDMSLYLMTGKHFTGNMPLIRQDGEPLFETIEKEIFIQELNIQELILYFYEKMKVEEFVNMIIKLYNFPQNDDTRSYNRLFKMLKEFILSIKRTDIMSDDVGLSMLRQVLDIEDVVGKIMQSSIRKYHEAPYTHTMRQEILDRLIDHISSLAVVTESEQIRNKNNIISLHNGVLIYYNIGYEMDISKGIKVNAFVHSDNSLYKDFSIENHFDLSLYDFALLVFSLSNKPNYFYNGIEIFSIPESPDMFKIMDEKLNFQILFAEPMHRSILVWMDKYLNLGLKIPEDHKKIDMK